MPRDQARDRFRAKVSAWAATRRRFGSWAVHRRSGGGPRRRLPWLRPVRSPPEPMSALSATAQSRRGCVFIERDCFSQQHRRTPGAPLQRTNSCSVPKRGNSRSSAVSVLIGRFPLMTICTGQSLVPSGGVINVWRHKL